ncbi:MAG: AmpG family muropeptide MFS transporter [Halothiobacillaceae bacterium]
MERWLSALFNRKQAVILVLGFASGLPLLLTSGTLQAWLTLEGIDIKAIGMFALAGLPYTLKFLWAPLLDRFVPPIFGRRRGWMLVTQLALIVALAGMAMTDPSEQLWQMATLALMVAFLSASQDIALDAWRTDTLLPAERGFGAALFVAGYRVGMLVAGAVALILGDQIGWSLTYLLMAGLMGFGILATLLAPDPANPADAPRSLAQAVVGPLREFFSRPAAWILLALIVLYKFGDAFAGTLTTTFLIRGAGFTATDVGIVNNGMGLAVTIFGALVGGAMMAKLGLFRSLMIFGLLQAVTNLGYSWLALQPGYALMVLTIGVENFAGGMGTAAFVALLMALCDARFSATQFALLSALSALGRVYLGPAAGFAVEWVDWAWFFVLTFIAALPGLWLLWKLRARIERLDANDRSPEQVSSQE